MLTYQVKGPTESGHYLVGYPTPGAEHVFTLAGCATNETTALRECARLNEEQVAGRRESMVRNANMISNDLLEQGRRHER
ncbi:MAG: hypothetical protein ACXV99_12750 [Candidatus Angelobacter sp.]